MSSETKQRQLVRGLQRIFGLVTLLPAARGSGGSLGHLRAGFLLSLSALLWGYMYFGRGFAHLGSPPLYVGEVVLALGAVTVVATLIAEGTRWRGLDKSSVIWPVALLAVFMIAGVARTVPYVWVYGLNALRDAVLWGYALFAVFMLVLVRERELRWLQRTYLVAAVGFAFWAPVAWYVFANFESSLPVAPDSSIPLLFFKNQEMAVHATGALAALVLWPRAKAMGLPLRIAATVGLLWTIETTGSFSRGAMLAAVSGLAVCALYSRSVRSWLPVLAAAVILIVGQAVAAEAPKLAVRLSPQAALSPTEVGPPAATSRPGQTVQSGHSEAPPASGQTPSPEPSASTGAADGSATSARDLGLQQWGRNLLSIVGQSQVEELEGTRRFRLAWWSKIISYTFGGPYFWTGKGFGINLADDDGFQVTADGSLRTPHNSHLTVLARMGVPGLVIWLLLQGSFLVVVVRRIRSLRVVGEPQVAALLGWILVYWVAIMVNTSFDPYLEGPQGGIWMWTLFGVGLVIVRLAEIGKTERARAH